MRNTLVRLTKNNILNMLEVLIPKVYEERYKTQCVTWAADSFLFGKNPDVYSFKPNPHGVDLKATLITERK